MSPQVHHLRLPQLVTVVIGGAVVLTVGIGYVLADHDERTETRARLREILRSIWDVGIL